jgi:hypothetical protein
MVEAPYKGDQADSRKNMTPIEAREIAKKMKDNIEKAKLGNDPDAIAYFMNGKYAEDAKILATYVLEYVTHGSQK